MTTYILCKDCGVSIAKKGNRSRCPSCSDIEHTRLQRQRKLKRKANESDKINSFDATLAGD